ncbi:DUF190 domain-containing protein [Hoyosella altamirensis]|uniref:DUF190 domain-containing protein n=1 Tax=Hoyosella altamirensis TaxID=616997 RepID=A0A839RT70_9ACTN|nr:DUF190 domain-containing protein [Hoyosella altamirensis]MBB3039547.1 hypothetical protein [Hoyosella altamirensis]
MTHHPASALRVMILLSENDTWHHKPLYSEVVHRARAAGLAGASVFRGIEGFGASALVHTSRILSLSEDLPIVVVIVDSESKVRAFLPELDEILSDAVVLVDPVEFIRYQTEPHR